MDVGKFTWVPFFEELLEKICNVSNPESLYQEFKKLVDEEQYTDVNKMDPLSYIGCICWGNNISIEKAKIAKNAFNLSHTLQDVIGIPSFVMGRYHYFHEIYNYQSQNDRLIELDNVMSVLWNFARQINSNSIKKETFEQIINYRDIRIGKLSQIMYICKPEVYYSCDSTMLSYLYKTVNNDYESFLEIQNYCKTFNTKPYLLSEHAWKYSQKRKNFQKYMEQVGQNLPSYQNYINRHIIREEELENKIFSLTSKRLFEINTSLDLNKLITLLKSTKEWNSYNTLNGNGIPNAILNTHYKRFLNQEPIEIPTIKSKVIMEYTNMYNEIKNIKNNEDNNIPLNQILYGPPGTGKTYNTVIKAMEIIDGWEYSKYYNNDAKVYTTKDKKTCTYKNLKDKFDDLKKQHRIEFVTFHQSYSYEEFVEGIKPKLFNDNTLNTPNQKEDNSIKYVLQDGIFKQICDNARKIKSDKHNDAIDFNRTRVFKMSLGNAQEDNDIYDYCIENNVVALGWGNDIDFTNCNNINEIRAKDSSWGAKAIEIFKFWMRKDDIIIISDGNKKFRAIAKITGDYEYNPNTAIRYSQFRPVKWLYNGDDISVSKIYDKNFSQQSIYALCNIDNSGFVRNTVKTNVLNDIITGNINNQEQENYVLIIDEINRGNISKIFGELITLIEKDKRMGNDYEMETTLPYSQKSFGVPNNLYIIGTMNTADRSIALLDTALRRRFDFVEMMPKPELLKDKMVGEINLKKLLENINARIKKDYDRDHQIGHSYFMDINDEKQLKRVYKNRILPLLNEYFYDDVHQVAKILNCDKKPDEDKNILAEYLLNDENILEILREAQKADI